MKPSASVQQSRWFLGEVASTDPHAAWVRVLLVGRADGSAWDHMPTPEELLTLSPNPKGVRWLQPPAERLAGDFIVFKVQETTLARPVRFQVHATHNRRADLALDLSDERMDRLELLREGTLELPPALTELRLRFPDDWWSDPVDMTGLRLATKYETGQGVNCRQWPAGEQMFWRLPTWPWLLALAPSARPIGEPFQRDVVSDGRMLELVLKDADEWLKSQEGKQIRPAIKALTEWLKKRSAEEKRQARWRVERAGQILADSEAEYSRREALLALLDHGPLKQEIDRLKGEVVEAVRCQAEQGQAARKAAAEGEYRRFEQNLEAKRQEAEQAFAVQRSAAETQLHQLKNDIAAQEREHDSLVQRLDVTLTERLAEIDRKAETFVAEHAILRASLRASPPPRRAEPWPTTDARRLDSQPNVIARLALHLPEQDAPDTLALGLHASFVSGGLPVLTGSRAEQALDAYARTVAGGRIRWLSVAPTALEPAHLLSSPAGLADVLNGAEADGGLLLIVLEGVNRAAIDAYLLPLLRARDARRELRLFPPDVIPPGMRWPDNVLLAATASTGVATLPLPASLWEHATLIATDALPCSAPPGTEVQARGVAASVWSDWRDAISHGDPFDPADLVPKPRRGEISLWRRLRQAVRAAGGADADAIGAVKAFGVLPVAARDPGVAGKLSGGLGPYQDVRRALDEIRPLVG